MAHYAKPLGGYSACTVLTLYTGLLVSTSPTNLLQSASYKNFAGAPAMQEQGGALTFTKNGQVFAMGRIDTNAGGTGQILVQKNGGTAGTVYNNEWVAFSVAAGDRVTLTTNNSGTNNSTVRDFRMVFAEQK